MDKDLIERMLYLSMDVTSIEHRQDILNQMETAEMLNFLETYPFAAYKAWPNKKEEIEKCYSIVFKFFINCCKLLQEKETIDEKFLEIIRLYIIKVCEVLDKDHFVKNAPMAIPVQKLYCDVVSKYPETDLAKALSQLKSIIFG